MTMRLSETVINAAFESHATRYARDKLWSIPYHMECWTYAHDAFDGGSESAFGKLYDELRTKWQVFRSQNYNAQTAEKIQQIMAAIPVELRHRRLSEFAEPTPDMLDQLWCAITTAGEIKQNKDGPSLVALTKFLHFWNPRLFVIADREVVWNWVLCHRWLWVQVEHVRSEIEVVLSAAVREHRYFKTDLMKYLAFLVWGGRVLRENPEVCGAFAAYVERHHEGSIDLNLREYESAALEWLLLGLVELPPAGIIIEQ